MATVTITISSETNPTYGGQVQFDGATYGRDILSGGDPSVSYNGSKIIRAFAFFDLSTDPTSGGTITKVELLATVNSVGGTHAISVGGSINGSADYWENFLGGDPPPTYGSDDIIFNECTNLFSDFTKRYITNYTPSTGAVVFDISSAEAGGSTGIEMVNAAIGHGSFFASVFLNNEAAAGSVVFDAATGFGLRITYTPAATGFNAM